MILGRSFLYIPANREKFLDKAADLPADAFILDLEDSVPLAEKAKAREGVRTYAPKLAGKAWVRTNSLQNGLGAEDLDAIIGISGLAGIFLPKVDSADEVKQWDRLIADLERVRKVSPGATKVVASIESAIGVLFSYQIATASPRVVSLAFGGAQDGDLNTDLGCVWSLNGPEMGYARAHTLAAARAARVDTPLDGVYADVRDLDGFELETAFSRRLGYRGRKLIHPSQIEPANRLYSPTSEEIDYYARVLEAFNAAVAQGSASTTVDGKMIDQAMATAARRMLDMAERLAQA
jgi:citrate lyase subunit beta/citryl-CoA lyase